MLQFRREAPETSPILHSVSNAKWFSHPSPSEIVFIAPLSVALLCIGVNRAFKHLPM